jgi:crotonobetainyl-CoA:carnitine CoA-transferase CaiB-like acyl-CoA transferase
MLHDLGAEVIKVEPPDGDLTRFSSPKVGSMATYFMQQNAGKKCVSIDLSTAEGADLFRRLVAISDVVIENYRAGVMNRLGLGWSTLRTINPRLVYASISGYGADGPWVDRRAYASVIGAESGMTRMQGESRGGIFANDPWSHADVYTALQTSSAVLAALFQRERTGHGEYIDVSMAETMLYVNEHTHDQLFDGDIDPHWVRSFRPGDYPVMTVADGSTVVMSAHPAERGTFELLVALMERPHLLEDSRFATPRERLEHLGALQDEMRDWAATVPDADEFERRCDAHGFAMGVMRSVREIAESEWARSRGAIVEIDDRSGGHVRVPNAPWHFERGDVGTSGAPRFRGEDNRTILRDLLGMDDATIDDLERRAVISSRLPRA